MRLESMRLESMPVTLMEWGRSGDGVRGSQEWGWGGGMGWHLFAQCLAPTDLSLVSRAGICPQGPLKALFSQTSHQRRTSRGGGSWGQDGARKSTSARARLHPETKEDKAVHTSTCMARHILTSRR